MTSSCQSPERGLAIRVASIASGNPDLLHSSERASLSPGAVASRQREFAAGRLCAAQAMRDLGLEPHPIMISADRSPIWPAEVVGSITHSSKLAAAAVSSKRHGIRAIGFDIEELTPLADELVEEICLESERLWLQSQPAATRGHLAKAIFSIKEAVYKCQYQLTLEMFGFERIKVEPDLRRNSFTAHFTEKVGAFCPEAPLIGKIWIAEQHIFSLLVLR